MTCARSARVLCILGATLIAHTLPIVAYGSGAGSQIRGIDQADVLGIDQADVLGIDQADVLGIDQADVLGIDQADVLGIDQADVLGIDQADLLGIDQADVLGIDQADVLGIDQADVLGIDQADALGIDQADVHGAVSSTLVLIGAIEAINYDASTFRSVGQMVIANIRMLKSLSVGDLVNVQGTIAGPGLLYADTVTVSAQRYVAGATEVYVTGVLSSVDASTGTAMIGALQVDYTSSLASGDAPDGVVWTFRGTQPNQKGVMLSDRVQAY